MLVIVAIFLILVISWFAYFNSGSIDIVKHPIKIESVQEREILVMGLDTPWAIDFLPSGEMIFTERGGKVSIYNFKTQEKIVVGEIDVSEISESGLLGIAVDPEFENNNFVYAYYTYDNGNRVSRFELSAGKLKNEYILLDGIPNARFHDGGRIKFGPDGKLYITTGDATDPTSAQDVESLAGKILRMNKDGSVRGDRHFGNHFGNYVYSFGHRNPQGLAWNKNADFFASEHGPTRNDEINIIIGGANYGWPFECTYDADFEEEIVKPILCYEEFTLAPSGIAFYGNSLYIAGLRGTQVRKIIFDENFENVISEEVFIGDLGRVRDVVSHDDYLYIATSNKDGRGVPRSGDDKILRVKLAG